MRALASMSAVFVIALALWLPAIRGGTDEPGPQPTFTSQMWGGIAPAGWGFTQATISNPGPTVSVTPGEIVDFTLNSIDLFHEWHLDLDGDNITDVGEPASGQFGPSGSGMPYSFNAPLSSGAWWYSCAVHGWDFQRGRFVVGGNAPPTVTLTNPSGAAQTWSGGSLHTVAWTMSDPDGLPSQLTVYANYTSSAGSGTIAGPTMGITSTPWTVPLANVGDMTVRVDVVDAMGARATDAKQVPNVDSTAPTITARAPTNGATGVPTTTPIDVTFSEAMNQPSAQGAFSFCRMPGCNPVPVNFVSWTANTLRMQPASTLSANTVYQASVGTAARDASDPGNPMGAPDTWSFRTANTPPTVSVTSPTGTSRWTGGSTHTIAWTATDAEDLPSSLTVWVNYSATGAPPWTAVLSAPGTTTSSPWTVPMDDTTIARLQFEVEDSGGMQGVTTSPAFTVDSTAPTVLSTNPNDGATGVATGANLLVTFSESMNTAVTGNPSVVGLQDVASSVWVPLSYSWDGPASTLTANPLPLLAPMTAYRLYVNGSARDAADPGLTKGTQTTVNFTTSGAPDTTPPTIQNVVALPSSQVSGGSVNISATVTDDDAVASVAVNVTQPDTTTQNLTMDPGAGNVWSLDRVWTLAGAHPFVVWAVDRSGNAASAAGTFTITASDTTPPVIVHTPPASVRVGQTIHVQAVVTDDALALVKIDYVDVRGTRVNVTMALQGGTYTFTIPAQAAAGTVRYTIYAEDASGNVAVTPEHAVAVEAAPAPVNYTPLILAIVALLVITLVAWMLVTRRRKKAGQPKESKEPKGPT